MTKFAAYRDAQGRIRAWGTGPDEARAADVASWQLDAYLAERLPGRGTREDYTLTLGDMDETSEA